MDPTRSLEMPSCSAIDLAEIRRSSKISSWIWSLISGVDGLRTYQHPSSYLLWILYLHLTSLRVLQMTIQFFNLLFYKSLLFVVILPLLDVPVIHYSLFLPSWTPSVVIDGLRLPEYLPCRTQEAVFYLCISRRRFFQNGLLWNRKPRVLKFFV
jgi:hypothetical protein